MPPPRYRRSNFCWTQSSLREHLQHDIQIIECDWGTVRKILKNRTLSQADKCRCTTIKHLLRYLIHKLRRLQNPAERHLCHIIYPLETIESLYHKFISLFYCMEVDKLKCPPNKFKHWKDVCYTLVDLYTNFGNLIRETEVCDE